MGYLLDTNVVIDYVAERYLPHQLLQLDAIVDEALNISIITKIEALGYNGDPEKMIKMALFIQVATIFPLTDQIAAQTIILRKARKMKTPDAIIAATALVHRLTLLSRNLSDFKNIAGLTIIDPHGFRENTFPAIRGTATKAGIEGCGNTFPLVLMLPIFCSSASPIFMLAPLPSSSTPDKIYPGFF